MYRLILFAVGSWVVASEGWQSNVDARHSALAHSALATYIVYTMAEHVHPIKKVGQLQVIPYEDSFKAGNSCHGKSQWLVLCERAAATVTVTATPTPTLPLPTWAGRFLVHLGSFSCRCPLAGAIRALALWCSGRAFRRRLGVRFQVRVV